MASFGFAIDSLTIQNTRSKHKDTDYLVCVLEGGNLPPQIPQVRYLGDLNSGTFQIELPLPFIVLAPGGPACILNYMIVNAGAANGADVANALINASAAWASGQGPAPRNFIGALEDGQNWFNEQLGTVLQPGGCDGMVAAEKDQFAYEDLSSINIGQFVTHEIHHPGTRSPSGCGPNSQYTVKWSMLRVTIDETSAKLGSKT